MRKSGAKRSCRPKKYRAIRHRSGEKTKRASSKLAQRPRMVDKGGSQSKDPRRRARREGSEQTAQLLTPNRRRGGGMFSTTKRRPSPTVKTWKRACGRSERNREIPWLLGTPTIQAEPWDCRAWHTVRKATRGSQEIQQPRRGQPAGICGITGRNRDAPEHSSRPKSSGRPSSNMMHGVPNLPILVPRTRELTHKGARKKTRPQRRRCAPVIS